MPETSWMMVKTAMTGEMSGTGIANFKVACSVSRRIKQMNVEYSKTWNYTAVPEKNIVLEFLVRANNGQELMRGNMDICDTDAKYHS